MCVTVLLFKIHKKCIKTHFGAKKWLFTLERIRHSLIVVQPCIMMMCCCRPCAKLASFHDALTAFLLLPIVNTVDNLTSKSESQRD